MTYQESFATALKLKDYVRLYDKQAWIYFIFTSETEFSVKVFDCEPSSAIKHRLQYEAFSVKKIPMAAISTTRNGETFIYRDLNVTVEFDLKTDSIIDFDGEESAPIDMNKARKSFSELLKKLK